MNKKYGTVLATLPLLGLLTLAACESPSLPSYYIGGSDQDTGGYVRPPDVVDIAGDSSTMLPIDTDMGPGWIDPPPPPQPPQPPSSPPPLIDFGAIQASYTWAYLYGILTWGAAWDSYDDWDDLVDDMEYTLWPYLVNLRRSLIDRPQIDTVPRASEPTKPATTRAKPVQRKQRSTNSRSNTAPSVAPVGRGGPGQGGD